MKFGILFLFIGILFIGNLFSVSAQVDSVLGQITTSNRDTFAGGITGNGRFVVFESMGDIATENPRNADGNSEIFLFDYAQRRIFQITDTKSLLIDPTKAPTFDNVRVEIVNSRPVISNQPDSSGHYWIAFGSNATCNYPGNPTANPPLPPIAGSTNPGQFDPNEPGTSNPCNIAGPNNTTTSNLVNDGNTEMWLYRVPLVAPVANLSEGEEVALTSLSGGLFVQATNTLPSRLPVAGSTTSAPIIAVDNRDASIAYTGDIISFTSNRDLVPCPATPSPTCGNSAPDHINDEIFVFVREAGTPLVQITATPRGTVAAPIFNANSTISRLPAGGYRVAFTSNANNPIVGMTGGNNTDNNEEIFYADLDTTGAPTGVKTQVTVTSRTNPGDLVNILNYGRRMSLDGRYIAFDSYADLTGEHNNANQPGFATFVYDTTLATNAFRRVLARSNADSAAPGGDVFRYPGFTDYDAGGAPQTLVLETRMNIKPDGTIPTNPDEGLNNSSSRQAQVYSVPLGPTSGTFTRLTKLPPPAFFLVQIQPLPSNSLRRMVFNLGQTEIGTGNRDLGSEAMYFILPVASSQSAATLNFATGASRMPVSPSPVPSPTATPTPSPSPTVSPTPQTPPAVHGVSPGMLAILNYESGINQPVVARTAVGSIERRFTLPIELSGVTMTIDGAAVGLKYVSQRQIEFVVPPGLAASADGTSYPVVINNNGTVFKGRIVVVPARPDIFTKSEVPGPGGRALVFNVTNRVHTSEPFTVTTFRLRGSRRVPTVLRLYMTGVQDVPGTSFAIRIGNRDIPAANITTTQPVLVEPGVYAVDFTLPAALAGAGDQPIVVSLFVGGRRYDTRLDDTAPRLFII